MTRHSDGVRLFQLNPNLHEVGRQIGDLPMQVEDDLTRVPIIVQHHIISRGSVESQSTTHDPLIETLQPPQTGTVQQIHEVGMDGTRYGGLPPQVKATITPFPDRHSAGWKNRKRQVPVVDLNRINTLAHSGLESRLLNHKLLAFQTQVRGTGSPLIFPDFFTGVS